MFRVIISALATLLVIAAISGDLLFYLRGHGFSAHAEPSWMERVMARNARKIATPADAKKLANPRLQQTPDMIGEADR